MKTPEQIAAKESALTNFEDRWYQSVDAFKAELVEGGWSEQAAQSEADKLSWMYGFRKA